ncbi:MAG: SpoIIE family protein phosphatase [Candidatus Riflebacteria bacterium]|nr:SpoIIE family protein phosphatase [Candidatus Riflebacteria bacterium]
MTAATGGRRPPMKILLAGSPGANIGAFHQALQGFGFEVVVTTTPAATLTAFHVQRPPVVILHADLAARAGQDLGHRLREAAADQPCFMVLLHEGEEAESVGEAVLSLFDDVLCRPWKTIELRARLRTWERVVRLQADLQAGLDRLAAANTLILRANDQMKKDLYAVAKIQTSLLPATLPVLEGAEFAWAYRPRSELAGDGLNVFRLDEHHVACYILDVSGQGTSAALLSVSLSRLLSPFPAQSALLKELAATPPGYLLRSPAAVLGDLNRDFPLDLATKEFFTILYGILDLRNGLFTYASAGHPRPVVVSGRGRCRLVPAGGFPIGFVEGAAFEARKLRLQAGDRLFLFSDGLPDAMDADRVPFSREGMLRAMKAVAGLPLKQGVDRVLAAAEGWCGPGGFHDDVSLLALEFRGPAAPRG